MQMECDWCSFVWSGRPLRTRRTAWPALICPMLLFAAIGLAEAAASEPVQKGAGWAFQPIRAADPPSPKHKAVNPIDAFVFSKLDQKGLKPAPHAHPHPLLRRVYFDLIGLPPPPEEIEAFAKDKRPEAWAELVDRLLASPQYGERWARHWLDLVRYADTGGFEHDLSYRNAWRYRDYVIRALNTNKPLD